jgi:hypothetical protein
MLEAMISWLYPAAGVIGAIAAIGALTTRKGGDMHRRTGRAGFWAMLVLAGCVIWTGLSANGYLPLLLGLLSGYLAISGYRALYLKRSVPRATFGPTRAGALDKGLAQLLLVTCCAVSAWGMMALPAELDAFELPKVETVLMIVIGLAGAMLALRDLGRFRTPPPDPNRWLIIHVTRMLCSVTVAGIAASVEFAVSVPEVLRWAVPATAGGIAIWITVRWLAGRLQHEGDPRSYYDIRIAELHAESEES